MTPRTGDDAGLLREMRLALFAVDEQHPGHYGRLAKAALSAVRSWDEANAESVQVDDPYLAAYERGYRDAVVHCRPPLPPAPGEAAALPVRKDGH